MQAAVTRTAACRKERRDYPMRVMDRNAKNAVRPMSRTSSCFQRLAMRPIHSRMKALGQNHHFVRLLMPSASRPARAAHMPLRNTW